MQSQIKTKLIFLKVTLLFSTLAFSTAFADSCGVIKLEKNRSPGTNILKNNCTENDELSMDAILQINAGARLWLESTPAIKESSSFHIICQNIAATALTVKVKSPILPWISPEGAIYCSAWVNDRLECKLKDGQETALFCAIAKLKTPPVPQSLERKTSLTMRGINPASASEAYSANDEVVNFLKPRIDLCRKVFQARQAITLTWTVKSTGEAIGTTVKETGINSQLADCAIEAIENYNFPLIDKDIQITFSF